MLEVYKHVHWNQLGNLGKMQILVLGTWGLHC